jgi:choline dehydrogenase
MIDNENFDYIVVGAGSAGCAAAARLSEEGDARVALIEAGPLDRGRLFEIPGLFGRQQKSATDWDLQTEPEPQLGDRRAYLPRGRVVGGTSSMNTMVYTRGHAHDYDEWSRLGCDGWSYREVLPYFRRAEDNERGEDLYHGVGGPLAVSDGRSVHPLLSAWVAAAVEAGHQQNHDFNGATQEGVGLYQMTQRDGLRCSSAVAYLRGAGDNLTVISSAAAVRIVLEGTRARGVEIEQFGERHTLRADREIVISCGAYLSPQLLMLSGIGPAEHLREAGLPVVVDLAAVGENLQDHPGCFIGYLTTTPDLAHADTPANETRLRDEGDGPLTWNEGGGFLRSDPSLSIPDIQFHAAPGLFRDEGLAPAFASAISFGPYVCRPESRGTVRLRSNVPSAKPRILHNFLAAERDRSVLREALRIALEIGRQPALGAHTRSHADSVAAGLQPTSDSDEALDDYMRRATFSFYHPCGTCSMGSVVDSSLRVHGVDGLRVADTSVMPRLLGGNTNAPAIMIGERVSDFIRGRTLDPASLGERGQVRAGAKPRQCQNDFGVSIQMYSVGSSATFCIR